jgi:hypothetical protein
MSGPSGMVRCCDALRFNSDFECEVYGNMLLIAAEIEVDEVRCPDAAHHSFWYSGEGEGRTFVD